MNSEARTLLLRAEKARTLYQLGKINRGQAKAEIEPYINHFNEKSKKIAKKYNQKPKLTSFVAFIR